MDFFGIKMWPFLRVQDNLDMKWLGLTRWSASMPDTSTMIIQARILDQPKTLERVIAHEVIHHLHHLSITDSDMALLKLHIKPEGHGKRFLDDAAKVNAIMGPNFVTVTSDQDDTLAPNKRPFYVLVDRSVAFKKLGWAWAAKLTPKIRERIAEVRQHGGKLFQTTDHKWTGGAKIQKYGGMSIPRIGQTSLENDLKALFESGKEISGV
jgi:hypothetical protein